MIAKPVRYLIWFALSVPALLMLADLLRDAVLPMDLLHPSGETSVRLVILAMLPGPLIEFFGATRFLRFWLAFRRNLGVAAFGYAFLHLAFYILDMQSVSAMIDELALPAIWTGWIALFLMAVPAGISFDGAMRALGRRRWKTIQRLVYGALALMLVHWVLIGWQWQPALIHLSPLLVAWALRAIARRRRLQTSERIA